MSKAGHSPRVREGESKGTTCLNSPPFPQKTLIGMSHYGDRPPLFSDDLCCLGGSRNIYKLIRNFCRPYRTILGLKILN